MGFDKRESAKIYTPQDNDTLKAIAEREIAAGNEVTWQEIAKFNWGTDDEDEVNEYLRDELGTHKRDESNNFVISDDDEPNSDLLIPVRFKKTGMALNTTHTLRVKQKTSPKQFLECSSVPGITFEFDKSFIRPTVVEHIKKLEEAIAKFPDAKIMIFGHTDKSGSDTYNKSLSERRAKSVYAFITDDPDTWESLYNQENWGMSVIQQILKDFGDPYDPGRTDGVQDARTTAAIRQYQDDRGLTVDGIAGPETRRNMFIEYMTTKHDVQLSVDQFMDPKHMGCGEFNPVDPVEGPHEPNRRVMFYLFNKDRLPKLPCKYGNIAPCNKQMTPPTPRFYKSFRCSFYDSLARKCKCEVGPVVPEEDIKLLITSPGIEDGKKVSHGAAVMLNDDHDNGQFYGAAPPAGHRQLEPIFDLDHLSETPAEDDLLEIKINLTPAGQPGNVELKVTEGATRIRLWPKKTKGGNADLITLPATFPASEMPKTLFVEGIQTGKVTFEASYSKGGKSFTDKLVVNVVELRESQGGTRKVLYDYNSDIVFEVFGAPANYEYEWDLDGNGSFNTATFETGKTTARVTCKYGPAEDANTVRLDQTAANTRKVYDVAVKMTGGLVLHVKGTTIVGGATIKGMRVSLGSNQGQALPAQSTAGLHTLFNWNDNVPVTFNVTTATENAEYAASEGITSALAGANRIQYGPLTTSNAVTPRPGVGAGRRVIGVIVGPTIWTTGQVREDLVATVNHEIQHLRQHVSVRDNAPVNNVWRLLDNHFGGAGGYVDIREADGHFTELLDPNVSWRHNTLAVQGDIVAFRNRYNQSINAVIPGIPAGATRTATRELMQNLYSRIPFFEMKRPGYDNFVRAPS